MLCLSDFELYSRWVPLDYRKRAENLHKHAHAEILQTDAFTLQISSQKKAPRLVLVKIPVPAQRRTF